MSTRRPDDDYRQDGNQDEDDGRAVRELLDAIGQGNVGVTISRTGSGTYFTVDAEAYIDGRWHLVRGKEDQGRGLTLADAADEARLMHQSCDGCRHIRGGHASITNDGCLVDGCRCEREQDEPDGWHWGIDE